MINNDFDHNFIYNSNNTPIGNRVKLFNYEDDIYGYYILDQEIINIHRGSYGLDSLSRKLKRCLVEKWSPITGVFKLFTELLSYGLDEVVNINEDPNHDFLTGVVPEIALITSELSSNASYASFLSSNFTTGSPAIGFLTLFMTSFDCSSPPWALTAPEVNIRNFLSTSNFWRDAFWSKLWAKDQAEFVGRLKEGQELGKVTRMDMCENVMLDAPKLSSSHITNLNFISSSPPSLSMTWLQFISFKLRLMLKSMMVLSGIIL